MKTTATKWLVAGGTFELAATTSALIISHKYIEPLDASAEMLAGAIATSGILYLLGLITLGYGVYQLLLGQKKDKNLSPVATKIKVSTPLPNVLATLVATKIMESTPLPDVLATLVSEYEYEEKHAIGQAKQLTAHINNLIKAIETSVEDLYVQMELKLAINGLNNLCENEPVTISPLYFNAPEESKNWSGAQKVWYMFFGKHVVNSSDDIYNDRWANISLLEYISRNKEVLQKFLSEATKQTTANDIEDGLKQLKESRLVEEPPESPSNSMGMV